MPTIDATISGTGSNSYGTRAEADTYFDGLLSYSRWAALADDDKDRALISAASSMGRFRYHGLATSETQALAFPRVFLPTSDGLTIPREIKVAQFEGSLSLYEIEAARSAPESARRAALQADGVTSFTIGNLSESFGSRSSEEVTLSAMGPVARQALAGWINRQGQLDSGRRKHSGGRLNYGLF